MEPNATLHPVEVAVNTALDDTTVKIMIAGPCPKTLFTLLATLPQPHTMDAGKSEREEDKKAEIAAAAMAVQQAQQDVDASQSGSIRLQEMTQSHLQECQAALKMVKEKHMLNPTTTMRDDELSFAMVDRKRANAVTNFEQWQMKAAKRSTNVLQESLIFMKALEDTIATLGLQKAKVEELQGNHARVWEAHQQLISGGD
jgi:hypothetical protein